MCDFEMVSECWFDVAKAAVEAMLASYADAAVEVAIVAVAESAMMIGSGTRTQTAGEASCSSDGSLVASNSSVAHASGRC